MQRLNPEYIAKTIEMVNSSPLPQHISMTLTHLDFDEAFMALEISDVLFQPFGIVHGGIVATLIDSATFWAVFCRIPDSSGLVNVDLKLNYLQSVTQGKLLAEGKAIRTGGLISYAEARIYTTEKALVAHGTSTLVTLPGKGLSLSVPKFIEEHEENAL